MRSAYLVTVAAVCPVLSVGCVEQPYEDTSSIVFSISEHADTKTGAVETSASYEFLELADAPGGWDTHYLRDNRDDTKGSCWFERFEHRLGRPRVEGGVATFHGGSLPGDGLRVFANQPESTKIAGPGWKTGDFLYFEAEGFAMPTIPTLRMSAPTAELTIDSPPATDTPLTLRPSDDVTVAWRPIDERFPPYVLVALSTEEPAGPGGTVRCFFPGEDGSGVVGRAWIARLFDSAAAETPGGTKKGTLEIATHRQLTILARGGWTVYVVASAVHRVQPFVSAPN